MKLIKWTGLLLGLIFVVYLLAKALDWADDDVARKVVAGQLIALNRAWAKLGRPEQFEISTAIQSRDTQFEQFTNSLHQPSGGQVQAVFRAMSARFRRPGFLAIDMEGRVYWVNRDGVAQRLD